ncbi:uncharacterized protein LOC126881537 [Diabrotica virgifera virgifera]|uniref:CHK kinase-like domain-containing protein n=1 Tax=Diabrotica virgifera virgifera TaxID=50390 RepID=A0ABM5JV62_DIAVI|nr:uncharacterized protein LOC126881537 [Diabrotica virgifera virgifera]
MNKFLTKLIENLSIIHIKQLQNKSSYKYGDCDFCIGSEQSKAVLNIIKENVDPPNFNDVNDGVEKLLKKYNSLYQARDESNKRLVPMVYNTLLTIFVNTTQLERQKYYQMLLDMYYNNLNNFANKWDGCEVLPTREEFESQIKDLIPHVKLDMVRQAKEQGRSKVLESVSELLEVFLYPQIFREDCYKIVTGTLRSSEYIFNKFEVVHSGGNLGLLGDYFKINIFFNFNNKDQTIRCFAKYLPVTNEITLLVAKACFKKEIFMYSEFMPSVLSLGINEIEDVAPHCYLIKKYDCIILEDLSSSNYVVKPMELPAEYDWLAIVTKQLAKLHASSWVYEEKMSAKSGKVIRISELYKDHLKEYLLSDEEPAGVPFLQGCKFMVSYILEQFPDLTEGMELSELKKVVKAAFKEMYKNVGESKKFRNVICQGDIHSNNILVKYNEDNKPESCKLVDYQISRYCSPVVELLVHLYMNTNKANREKYMEILLDLYHAELTRILGRYDIDINEILTYSSFLEAVNEFKLTGMCITATYIQILFIPKHLLQDLNTNPEKAAQYYVGERKEGFEQFMKHDSFKNKLMEMVEEMYNEIKRRNN